MADKPNGQAPTPDPETKRIAFTDAIIKAIVPSETDNVWHRDTKTSSLLLRTKSSGRKSFFFSKWYGDEYVSVHIADFPKTSVEQARILAEFVGAQAEFDACFRAEMTKRKQRFPFTEAAVKAIARPATGVVTYYDAETPGLQLEITAAGTKRFVSWNRDWWGGGSSQVCLGNHPQLSLDQAQRVARNHSRIQYAILEPRQN